MNTTEATTKVHNIDYLAEMLGSECDETTAAQARDNLVAAGLLTWDGDSQGGRLADVSEDRFYSVAFAA